MRVLVVEDQPELLRLLAAALRENGYAVDTAADGEEGLFKAQAWDYDVIVLDVMLPKRDGWTILETVRQSKRTPILMLTARDTVKDRVRGLDSGADDYLVKPFDLAELLARVRSLIRRATGQPNPVIDLGDIQVDTVAKVVRRNNESAQLTATEYALVELLALHCGKLVSRTMIYEHLFDEDDDSLSNLVEVHISNIRRKLGRDFITTRRGLGYMLELPEPGPSESPLGLNPVP